MNNSEKLLNVFSNALGIRKEKVNEDLAYQTFPQWDSISHMVLITELEDTFDIRLDDKDVLQMDTYSNVKSQLKKYNISFD